MCEFEQHLKLDFDYANNAQALAGASFSLWRAVFLGEEAPDTDHLLDDAKYFMRNLVAHNMVAYTQDRNARQWSFMYYINNAKYRLLSIKSDQKEEVVPLKYNQETYFENNQIIWDYYQNMVDESIVNIRRLLEKKRSAIDSL